MIGLDANVLVRVFVLDSPDQTKAALGFLSTLSEANPGFIGLVVIVELAWVLKRNYAYSDQAMFTALETLFESENIEVENSDLVEQAIRSAKSSGADFADTLIALVASRAGATTTVTFEKNAAKRIPGMELLA